MIKSMISEEIKTERNANIEFLRILSMLMIMTMHCLAQTGALYDLEGPVSCYYWWLEALCVPAVNVFVLISGYFLVESQFKVQNLFRILGVVWSYSFLFSLLNSFVAGESISVGNTVQMLFPVLTKKYWFVNAYLALYLLSPFLNRLIHSISRVQFKYLLTVLLVIMVIRPTLLPRRMAQDSTAGLSVFFFIVLYFISAWERIYGRRNKRKPVYYVLLFFILSFFPLLCRWGLMRVGVSEDTAVRFYSYDSANVVLQALALFFAFLSMHKLSGKYAVSVNKVAKLCFAAYIIHYAMNRTVWHFFHLRGIIPNVLFGTLSIITSVLIVFFACIAIEKMRQLLLKKIEFGIKLQQMLELWNEIVNADSNA